MLFRKITLIAISLLAIKANAQQVVKASNVNLVTTPGTHLVINGGITFTGTSTLTDSGQIFILKNTIGGRENWSDSVTGGVYSNNSNGKVIFGSDSLQYIYGDTQFWDMRMNNDSGAYLNSDIEVRNQLDLDTGILYTVPLTTKMYVSNAATTSIGSTSAFARSRVNGRLERATNVTTPFYLFPVGKDTLYAPVKIAKQNANIARYTIEYFPDTPFQPTNIQNPPIHHLSQLEYWEITSDIPTGADDDAKVSLSWRGYSMVAAGPSSGPGTPRDSLLVAQYIFNPSGRWEVPGLWASGNVVGTDSLFGYVTTNAFTSNFTFAERRFTLGSWSKYNLLPIKLVSFTAAADGNKVRLNWDIRNDQDVKVYEIERSLNASNFSTIGSVNSLQRTQWLYVSFDNSPVMGWNYYRLKIIDKNGDFTYSEIRKVKFEKGLQQIKIFPNPTTELLNIQLPTSFTKVMIQLFSSDGKLISTLQPSSNLVQLNVMNLPSGTYIVRIINNGNAESYPFIKQ